jgi:hypothetical protein
MNLGVRYIVTLMGCLFLSILTIQYSEKRNNLSTKSPSFLPESLHPLLGFRKKSEDFPFFYLEVMRSEHQAVFRFHQIGRAHV